MQTSDGGFVVAGVTTSSQGGSDYFVLKIDNEGNIEWQKRYGKEGFGFPSFPERANSIKQTADNGYIVFGYTGSIDLTRFVMYLIKIDAIGNLEWQNFFWDYYGNSYGRVAQISDDGSIIISGNWYGRCAYHSHTAKEYKIV